MQTAHSPTDWEQYYDRRDPALRERLILQYAPLVKYVVGRMSVSLPGVLNHEDLLSYGTNRAHPGGRSVRPVARGEV